MRSRVEWSLLMSGRFPSLLTIKSEASSVADSSFRIDFVEGIISLWFKMREVGNNFLYVVCMYYDVKFDITIPHNHPLPPPPHHYSPRSHSPRDIPRVRCFSMILLGKSLPPLAPNIVLRSELKQR